MSAMVHGEISAEVDISTARRQLDFGQNSTGSSAGRDTEHRIVLDDLMSALEH